MWCVKRQVECGVCKMKGKRAGTALCGSKRGKQPERKKRASHTRHKNTMQIEVEEVSVVVQGAGRQPAGGGKKRAEVVVCRAGREKSVCKGQWGPGVRPAGGRERGLQPINPARESQLQNSRNQTAKSNCRTWQAGRQSCRQAWWQVCAGRQV